MPPIWSVESDDPNLAAVLETLVDIKKGNTLVRGAVGRNVCVPEEASATNVPCEAASFEEWVVPQVECLGPYFLGELPTEARGGRVL